MPSTIGGRADARSRGLRTAAQGAVSVVLVAIAGAIIDTVTPGAALDWETVGAAVAVAVVTALAAYVQRIAEDAKATRGAADRAPEGE